MSRIQGLMIVFPGGLVCGLSPVSWIVVADACQLRCLLLERIPERVRRRSPNGPPPVVLCGNKVDLPYRRTGPTQTKFHREKGLRYYDISAKRGTFLENVFISIAKAILNDQSLVIIISFLPVGHRELSRAHKTL